MKSVLGIEEDETEADPHLYLLTASDFLTGLVKIGRSHKPFERALQLADGMPFHLKIFSIYSFAGAKEQAIHEQLRAFRVEGASSREWFRLGVQEANTAIGNILFGPRASCAKYMRCCVVCAADYPNAIATARFCSCEHER